MDSTQQGDIRFPRDLVEWAGNHSGGVKRLFDTHSGRPGKDLLRTHLINKLENWTKAIASGSNDTPRILLLVGGPGNGKTEAIEHTINCLDKGLHADGKLIEKLSARFHPSAGQAVPRVVRVNAGELASNSLPLEIDIVQDASVIAGEEGKPAHVLLIRELHELLNAPQSRIYLCCVNRGVLDDALIHALDNDLSEARVLLEAITRSVSLSANAPSCWPLKDFPVIAVWPMDAESLLTSPDGESPSPAALLLEHVTRQEHWSLSGKCEAGDNCPFCHSHALLSHAEQRAALLRVLRWYELASGKRWSFRDLFSLVSYMLAGHYQAKPGQAADPCAWAAHLLGLDKSCKTSRNPGRHELAAIFHLATSSYQHALFHHWDKDAATSLRQDLKDLALDKGDEDVRTIYGMLNFLLERKAQYLPATISPLLEDLSMLLDPALADPGTEVAVSSRTKVMLAELDTRFSRSLTGGFEFIRKYQTLSTNEIELLRRLARADTLLSSPSVRRKKPTAASRIQRMLRDFACRVVRRSICTRSAIVTDEAILQSFQQVVEDGKGQYLHEIAQQVKNLLNSRHGFEVSLTTTFGQPLPPQQRQAILIVQPQHVRPLQLSTEGRPRSPICFLQVGQGKSIQSIALTYDLFKAVKELERGLSPASLPRTVVALLDTTKARLSGPIVRDGDILTDAHIRIGSCGVHIVQSWNGFVALPSEEQP